MWLLYRLYSSPRQAFVMCGLAIGLAACEPDKPSVSEKENPAVPAKTEAPSNATAAEPLAVNVFLELSGGMKGFMPLNTAERLPTAFQNRVSNLASKTNSSPDIAKAQFLLGLNEKSNSVEYIHLRDVLQGQTKAAALGTELPTMLESLLKVPEASGRVNVIVSDFIYGPQDAGNFTTMKTRITDALSIVSKKRLAVAVIGETSRFYGTFYPAVKIKGRQEYPLDGQLVPYYIWVVGPPTLVSRYLKEVRVNQGDVQQAYFGLKFPETPYAALLSGLPVGSKLEQKQGDASVSYTTSRPSNELEISSVGDTAEFSIGLNLSNLPSAWQQPAFLAKQLQAVLPSTRPLIVPGSVRMLTIAERNSSATLARFTHVLRLRLTTLPPNTSSLTIRMWAPEMPEWVSKWSTNNDNVPGPKPQTYRLNEIMTGLREALPATLPFVFTASFKVTNPD